MKGKNIILLGTGGIVGFVSCGVIVAKKIFENDKTRAAIEQIIYDKVDWILDYCDNIQHYPSRTDDTVHYIFDDRKDAEKILDSMQTIIETYGFGTVSDISGLYNINRLDCRSNKYGWTDISGCKPIRVRNGWEIRLPKPIRID